MSAAEILERIRGLPPDEQRDLVELIMDEFGEASESDPELTSEQVAELERRVEELRKNPASGIPWEQVKADLKKRHGW
jgi:putative addiction module component (TIGR02574 family)